MDNLIKNLKMFLVFLKVYIPTLILNYNITFIRVSVDGGAEH